MSRQKEHVADIGKEGEREKRRRNETQGKKEV